MLRRLVLLLLVAVVLGSAAVWIATHDARQGTPLDLPGIPSAATESTDVPAREAPMREQQREVAQEANLERRTTIALDPVRVIEGRVVFPRGTPVDESAQVVLRAFPRADEDDTGEMMRKWVGEWDVAGRAEVGSGGRFVLPMPVEVSAMRVDLDANYLYLEYPVAIEDLSEPGPVELAARLGARVTFVLRPPENTTLDERVLVGRTVLMSHLPRNGFFSGSPQQIAFEVAADLTLEGRALGADRHYSLDRIWRNDSYEGLTPFVVEQGWDPILTAGEHVRVEIPLLDGLTLAGAVVDELGVPLEGASVSAECGDERWTFYLHAKTDEDGRFAIQGVYPALKSLHASGDGYVEAVIEGLQPGPGIERTAFELVLTRGLSISGTLRAADGRPVVGVDVEIRPSQGDGFWQLTFDETDEEGHFEVSGLAPGEYVVRAQHRRDGEANAPRFSVQRVGVVAGGPELALVLEAAPEVHGRVVDERGAAVQRFRLEAAPENREERFPASIDPMFFNDRGRLFESDDGTFLWDEVPAGRWLIAVKATGFLSPEPRAVDVPSTDALDFVMIKGASISGVVVDEAGAPVHRAQVSSARNTANMRSSGGAASSDELGQFRMDGLLPGRHALSAQRGGLATTEQVEVTIEQGQDLTGVRLSLMRGGRISCEVRRPDDRPAVGVSIRAAPSGNSGYQAKATTDGAGRAELGPLPPGEVLLTAYITDEDTNRWDSAIARVTVVSGETVRVAIGGSSAALTVRGRITCGGEAVAGCYVAAQREGGGKASVVSQADGSFELGLPAGGRVQFRLVPQGARNAAHFTEELPAEGVHDLAFELPAAGIRGWVEPADEVDPLQRVEVVAVRKAPGGAAPWTGEVRERARANTDGSFALLHIEPGEYDLFATVSEPFSGQISAGAIQRALEVGSGVVEDVVLRPIPTGAVSGTVLGTDGQPVEGAFVFARREDGHLPLSIGSHSEVDGSFALSGLPFGRVLLEATAPGLINGEPVTVAVREAGSTGVELRLGTGTMLHCRIADDSLTPSELSVRIFDSRGHDRALELPTSGRDSAANNYERIYGPLPPGTYRVELMRGAEPLFETSLELRGAPQKELLLGK